MFIDLDQFKLVNDACGHAAGDLLLKQVARLLGEVVRARDTLARLGGDEFALLLEHCTVEQAERVATQICARMDEFRFVHDERRFRIGASIGLVPVDSRWHTVAAVMQAGDTACYAAKEAGRNRVHTWHDTDQSMQQRQGQMQWVTRLEQALDTDQFQLFAQRLHPLSGPAHDPAHGQAHDPAHDPAHGLARGLYAEVLLRLPEGNSWVPPGVFLPAAERFHLAARIDRWVLQRVLRTLAERGGCDGIDTLCVNLSGQSVGDRAFHRWLVALLEAQTPALRQCLCLEITETVAVTHLADAALFVEQVRALGVRVALDDFGAGASSFGYLKRLGVDVLKIDGQFIQDLIGNRLNEAAVRCFVEVAQAVSLKTVAEFVDSPAVLARVHELGVDYAQGYLLHRPEPIETVLQTCAEHMTLA
jgi:diguanylate cyclase